MIELPNLPDDLAEERRRVYQAEEVLAEEIEVGEFGKFSVQFDDYPELEADERAVAGFCSEVATAAGWSGGYDAVTNAWVPARFTIVFDVPDESELAAWVDAVGTIHLHRLMCRRLTVVHELAHALDKWDGHRFGFRERMIELVRHAYDDEVARALIDRYREQGLTAPDLDE